MTKFVGTEDLILLLHSCTHVNTHSVVDCGPLNAPSNGGVEMESSVFNSVATYSCDSGFNLIGADSRTCQGNGLWSGQTPQCIGMLHV